MYAEAKGVEDMIDIPVIGKLLGGAYKIGKHLIDKNEAEQMRTIVDDLRRRAYANKGNCLKAEIGSEQDRFYSKMVAKGYLTRVPFGYMLPEYVQHRERSLY